MPNEKKSWKIFSAKIFAASLVFLLSLSNGGLLGQASAQQSPAAPGGKPARIVVADAKTTHHLNLYVAKELGLFEKRGLDVQIIAVDDNAAARDMVVSGGADVFWTCPTVAIAAIANGAPIRTIAQVKKPCTSVLLVPQSSAIIRLSDLIGKNIAGISPTCEAVISLTVAAKGEGANFNLQRLAGGPAIAALEGGRVDGAILEEPHASIAELAGFRVVFPEVSASIPCRTINAGSRMLAGGAEQLKAFISAIDEANRIIMSNPIADNIVKIAVDYTGAPEEAIIRGNHRLIFGVQLAVDGLIALGDELLALENIKENPGHRMFAAEFKGITW